MQAVVLVGKTNAGKSTLFNTLVGESASIVSSNENTTRDVVKRVYQGQTFYDTPGLRSIEDLHLLRYIMPTANIVCIVLSVEENFTKLHFEILKKYRHKSLCIVRTKKDLPYESINEISHIDSFLVSIHDMKSISLLRTYLLKNSNANPDSKFEVAIMGRSNVGKSTIANSLLGYDRFLVENKIGTTIEINQENVLNHPINFTLHDTPGYRKNKNLSDLEGMSQQKIINYLQKKWSHTQLCLMIVNAEEGLTKTDKSILDAICSCFTVLIIINKKDLVSYSELNDIIIDLHKRYKAFEVIAISTLSKKDIRLLGRIIYKNIRAAKSIEISTPSFNEWLQNLNIRHLKYGLHINGINCKIFAKKNPLHSEVAFMQRKFCEWFGLKGIKPIFQFVLQ